MSDKCEMLVEWLRKAVWILFIVIIGYLLIASIFSTCYMGTVQYSTNEGTIETNSEHTFWMRDIYWIHFVVFFVFSLLLLLKNGKEGKVRFRAAYIGIFVCIMAVMVYIVLVSQYYPKADQRRVMEIAAAIRNGDYSSLETGGYLFMYPHQKGIIFYFQILSFLFGDCNYVAFELINAIWILLTYVVFVKIGKAVWKNYGDNVGIGIAVLGLFFIPYLFYASYLYGTVVGVFFALLSFYMILVFQSMPKWRYLIMGSISMGVAVQLKSNFQIFLIAAVIYLVLLCVKGLKSEKKKIWKNLLFTLTIMICMAGGNAGMSRYISTLNGGNEVTGLPMVTYVAMGLQEGKGGPGWYTAYNNTVYRDNDWDYERTEKAAKEEIVRIVSGYRKDITAGISFFVKKISSQWNNPTFQSIWLLEEREGKTGLNWIMKGTGRNCYIFFTNLLQTWILAGTFLYAILRFKKGEWGETLLIIAFIGGFLFHLFWEAKAMYAMPFFILLLPLCVCGYIEWRSYLLERKKVLVSEGWNSVNGRRMKRNLAVFVAITIIVCMISYTQIFVKLFARNDDMGIFNIYTQDIVNQDEL